MGNYVLDFGPAVSGTPTFTVFTDVSDSTDYLVDAPTLDPLTSGWVQFTWSSGINVHFRAEINDSNWIAGTLSNVDILPVGDGSVRIDHNYGGTDNLRVLSLDTGLPLDNAFIALYLKVDYDAGRTERSLYAKGWTYSKNDGRWEYPLYLDAGTYTVLVTKAGTIPGTSEITIT